MAYIHTIAEADAEGPLAALYTRFGNPDGTVDDVLKVHSLNPASFEAHCVLYVQSMHKPSPLTRIERELIGVVVSVLNGCTYCAQHHAAGLRRLLKGQREDMVASLLAGEPTGLTSREDALASYATALTTSPATMAGSHVDRLRDAGLADLEILDAAQAIGYFAYANRIVLGLGATLEARHEIGQWPETD